MPEQFSREEQLEQKRAYWKQQIEAWQSSDMTQLAFCQEHDLKPHQFTYWKKRFVRTDAGVTFLPVKFQRQNFSSPVSTSDSLRILVGGDIEIQVGQNFDPRLLKQVIAAIRALP